MKVTNILNIKTGYSFKGAVINDVNGDIFVVQPKDIFQQIDFSKLTKVKAPNTKSSSPYLEKNDILLTARGSFKAYTFKKANKKCLVPASIYILRVGVENVNPEYITWYLNSPKGQKQMLSKLELMTVPSLSKNNIEEIEIPIIPLDKQNEIASLINRKNELEYLWKEKIKKQSLMLNQVANNLIQGVI